MLMQATSTSNPSHLHANPKLIQSIDVSFQISLGLIQVTSKAKPDKSKVNPSHLHAKAISKANPSQSKANIYISTSKPIQGLPKPLPNWIQSALIKTVQATYIPIHD